MKEFILAFFCTCLGFFIVGVIKLIYHCFVVEPAAREKELLELIKRAQEKLKILNPGDKDYCSICNGRCTVITVEFTKIS